MELADVIDRLSASKGEIGSQDVGEAMLARSLGQAPRVQIRVMDGVKEGVADGLDALDHLIVPWMQARAGQAIFPR